MSRYATQAPLKLEWADQRLFPWYVTLARGGGDCDNMSQVAKEFLDALSCKGGHDYSANVLFKDKK